MRIATNKLSSGVVTGLLRRQKVRKSRCFVSRAGKKFRDFEGREKGRGALAGFDIETGCGH